ncbi:MAG: response regulator transcription factor [Bacteroidetes bacterium]|nr:MAG: response regulator transcription factor [Bacteroidota bacterium]
MTRPDPTRPIEVVITDDHHIVREGLKKVFREEPGIRIAGEADSAPALLSLLRRTAADVLILDVNLPGRSGLDVLTDLRSEFPSLRILMLSMHPDDALAVRALKNGAAGYIAKTAAPAEIVEAVRRIAQGRRYVSPSLADHLADAVATGHPAEPHTSLSPREYEILCHLGAGRTVTEIAGMLSLSVPTVSTYRARILEKMDMTTTAELIRYAVTHRLTE